VVEHLAHISTIDGLNPTAVTGKEKVEENGIDEGENIFQAQTL